MVVLRPEADDQGDHYTSPPGRGGRDGYHWPTPAEPIDGSFPGRVAEAHALSITTYWACVSLISQDMAGVPWRHFERTEYANGHEGRKLLPRTHPDFLLNHAVNGHYLTAFTFRETLLSRALSRGNGYAEIERDLAGRPIAFWPLENSRVQPTLAGGELWYRVTNFTREDAWLPAQNVLHFRGLGDEVCGYSVLEAHARTLLAALDFDKYHRDLANTKTQTQLGGVLTTEKKLNEEAYKRLRDDFERRHLGKPNSVAVLEEGMKYDPRKFNSPADLHLIEARKYSADEICRIFKCPPYKVGILDRATHTNIEAAAIEYVTSCLLPWAIRHEQEADLKLLGWRLLGRQFTKHLLSALMRADSDSRAKLYEHQMRNGVITPNEAREMEDRNPLPGGDVPFIAAQLNTLDRAVKGDPVSFKPGGEQTAAPALTNADRLSAGGVEHAVPPVDPAVAMYPRVTKVAELVARRDAHRLCDAVKRLGYDSERFKTWLHEYADDQKKYFAEKVLAAIGPNVDATAADVVWQVEWRAAFADFSGRLTDGLSAGSPEALANRWAAERAPALAARITASAARAAAMYPTVT